MSRVRQHTPEGRAPRAARWGRRAAAGCLLLLAGCVAEPGTPGPAPAAPTAGPEGATFEQLQAMLAARGVTWQRLETVGHTGQWKFTCAIPNPQMPGTRRNYESTAGGPHGLD